MHKFLRTVGFSEYKRKRDIEMLLRKLIDTSTETKVLHLDEETNLCEMRTQLAPGMGLAMVGEVSEDGDFLLEYYYPYMEGTHITSQANCVIQRHTEKESYAGLLEEYKVGVSLIFYLTNTMEFLDKRMNHPELVKQNRQRESHGYPVVTSAMLTGLCVSGKVLLPVGKTKSQIESAKVAAKKRNSLIEAAKNGDEDAMESLTIEDIDLYAKITRRVLKEDVYSIVESTFIPCGVECDQYSVIGEIIELEELTNSVTGEKVWHMVLSCNDLNFNVAVNSKDLLGEPQVGRRFKGQIWMQGIANFKDTGLEEEH